MSYINLKDLNNSFYGNYSDDYCKENGLFIAYKASDLNTAEYKTRQIVDYSKDIVVTDLGFILGESQTITSDKEKAAEELGEILKFSNWNTLQNKILLQGLILGTTAVKIGVDDRGSPRVGFVDLLDVTLTPYYENDFVYRWDLTYQMKTGENGEEPVEVVESYTESTYQRTEGGKITTDVIPTNGWWLLVLKNRNTLDKSYRDWQGVGEWDPVRPLVDEINSIQSRLSRIEDIYADPKFLATGLDDPNQLKKSHKLWAVPKGSTISILEYQGNSMDSMQNRILTLERALKAKAPELVINDLGDISGYALHLKLSKLEKKINNLRDRYFDFFQTIFKTLYEIETGNQIDFNYVADETIPDDTESRVNRLVALHGLGVLSLETITTELGYDFKEEQKRIQSEALNGAEDAESDLENEIPNDSR